MNILDFKRKALGYTFRSADGASAADRGYTPGSNDKFIWSTQGTGDNEQRVYTLNPNYVAPPDPEIARAKIAAALGVPVSSVVPQYGTMLGGRDDNTQVTDYDNITGYAVKQSDSHGVVFDNAGKQIGVYNPSNKGGGGFLGELLAGLDDTLGLSKVVTGISGGLADLDSSLGLSKNAPAIVGLAASYFLPGIGQALGQSLVSSGVITGAAIPYATTIGTALAQTGVSVAQGKSLDQALGDAILSGGMSELTQAYGSGVKSAISQITDNPIAQKAIFKAGTDVVSAVAQGKTGDEVLQGIGRSVVSTVAGAAANEIVKNIPGIDNLPDAAKRVVTSGIATSIQGGDGTKSMLNTALREGTNYVLDTLTATPGASAANPMSQDPAQRAGATGVTANTVAGSAQTQPVTGGNVTETTLPSLGNTTNVTSITGGAADGSTGTNYVTPIRGGAADGSTGTNYVTPIRGGAADGSTGTNYVTSTQGGAADGSTGTNYVTPIKGGAIDASTGTESTSVANGLTKTGDANPLGNIEGAKLKGASGEEVKLTDAQLTDMVNRQLVFEGGDYNTKQDAANAARLAGYTQFEYDNSVYTMQPGGPTEKAVFQAVIDMQPTKGAAFNAARDLLGSNQVFDYKGSKLTTVTAEEQNARMQEAAYNDPSRALDNFYSGNIRYTGYDVAGDVAGKVKLAAPAQTILDQLIATGATGLGEQIETFAAGASLASGSSLQNSASNLGKWLVQYGKDANGLDVARQGENLQKQWKDAGNLSFFDQPGAIVKAIKENPLGFISEIGKEGFQEGLPLVAGAIVGGTALAFGAPIATGVSIVAGTSALLNGWESFGSGGKEAYDLAIKGGASENEAREKGVLNGSIHAAITIPLEFIGDKLIVGNYFRGVEGSLKEYAKKFGSTVAVNSASELVETVPQTLTTRASVVGWDNLTQRDVLSSTAAGFSAMAVSAGTTTGLLTPSTINEVVSIGKDYAGSDVSLGDFLSGKKTVDLSTLKSDAVLGSDSSGNPITFGETVVNNDYVKQDPTFLDNFFPTTFVDPLVTDAAEARQIAQDLGYTNPSQEVINSLTGPISEAEAQAKLDEFLSGMTAFESGKPVTAAEAQEMMKDLGLTGLSDADAISLATKIVESVPADMLAPDPNIQLASDAGFPDVATYTQYGGDKAAYNAAQADAANLAIAQAAGFPDYASYSQFGGNLAAYDKTNNDAANIRKATESGFPDYATFLQYDGNIFEYATAKKADENKQVATAAGFPDFSTYTQYGGDKASYDAAIIATANAKLATDAGFPDFSTYTQYSGNVGAFNKASQNSATKLEIETAIADAVSKINLPAGITPADVTAAIKTYMTDNPGLSLADVAGKITESTKGLATDTSVQTAISTALKDVATTADVNSAIAGIKFPAGITVADVANQIKAELAANPGLTANDVAKSISTYMTANPGLSAADVKTAIEASTKDFATKTDIEAAISGIQFPAGLTTSDVSKAIDEYMKANPGLTLRQVADAIAAATSGLPTEAGVRTTVADALKGVATKSDVTDAIAGIKFPPGLSKDDVVSAITTYMKDNPGLSLTDVASKITDATKGLVTSEGMKTALSEGLKGLATTKDVETAISNIKFPAGISKEDVSSAIKTYMEANPGLSLADVAAKITDATKGLATSAEVKADMAAAIKGLATTKDVETAIANIKFPAGLSKEDVAEQIKEVLKNNPGLSAADVTKSITDYMAANPALTLAEVAGKITDATKGLVTSADMKLALEDALKGTATTADVKALETKLTGEIAAAVASGLTGNEAIQKGLETLATKMGTNQTELLNKLGTTETAITEKMTTGLGELTTKIEGINKSLTDAIAVNEAAGLTRDQATTKAISDVATQLGTTKTDLLTQLGTTEAALTTKLTTGLAEVTTKIEGINKSLTDAIAVNEAAGLTRDQATQKAIDDVAGQLGTTKADLLTQLGTTEAALTTKLNTGLEAVNTKIESINNSLTTAIADAKATGLTGDAALQAAINKVAADQKVDSAALLTSIGATEASLKTQFASEIAGVTKDIQTKYDALTQGQKDIVDSQAKQGVDLNTAINEVSKVITKDVEDVKKDVGTLRTDTQTRFDTLDQGQKDLVISQVKLGVDFEKAIDDASKKTTQQITDVKTDLKKDIGDAQTQFNTRVDDLVNQGQTYQAATQTALNEIKATQAAEKVAAEAAAKAGRASTAQQGIARNLQQAAARVTPAPGVVDTSTPGFADIGLKTSGDAAKFEGPLEQYMKMLAGNSNAAKTQETQQPQQGAQVQDELSAQQQPGSDYFAYGQQTDIDLAQSPGTQMLYSKAGGLATPLFADGGTTRHGKYAGGGLNVVEHSGKHRIDFRTGNAVTGPGDGQSDDIPAMLADGEFVFPADVVAALGNGSTKAGSDKLYDMMHSIRAYHRSAKPRDLPPPAKKSPLDYLKKRKVRR
jgi:predicted transcriptional regulator